MRALLLAACLVTTTSSDGPPRKRLRGAVREIGDVQDELVRSEHRARRVERDLDVVLSAFSNGTRAFARRRRRSGGDKTRSLRPITVSGRQIDTRLRERYFGEFNGESDDNYARVWAEDAASAQHGRQGRCPQHRKELQAPAQPPG